MPLPARARAILEFWFGELDGDGMPAPQRMQRWFKTDAAFDAGIRERFAADLQRAGELGEWEAQSRGALALVILTDQFPRNIHRGSPEAFAHDEHARAVTIRALDSGADRELHPIERAFLYMPLEHAEDLVLQERSLHCFRELAGEAPAGAREAFASFVGYAESHREVIARFGRFPHRNAVLGRRSSAAETEYLESGAVTWGQ